VPAIAAAAALMLMTACGGNSTGPTHGGPPTISAINGAPKPSGFVGMAVAIQGTNFGDAAHGKVLFTVSGGAPIQATIANASTDWSGTLIVATVPSGVTGNAQITVQTSGGTSNAILFTLISNAPFSPSTITWTATASLPSALTGLGAAVVPVPTSSAPEYVFTIGGADTTGKATTIVYRSQVQASGALGAWTTSLTPLPQPRAYETTVAATAYNSGLDTTSTAAYLYAIGGVDATGQAVTSAYVAKVALDGSIGAWATTTALPTALHSAAGVAFDGYIYLTGGAGTTNAPVATAYRAAIHANGTLGSWQSAAALPQATAYHQMAIFGPYVYVVGGDNGTVTPSLNTSSGTETGNVYLAQINPRDGTLSAAGWTGVSAMGKARSKHSTLAAGGALLTSSGVYGGSAGSSENRYANLNADGTLASWSGATGTNTIAGIIGASIYNEAAVAYSDVSGVGHVLLLGGADRATGKALAFAVYY
jgi:hypothetical protein